MSEFDGFGPLHTLPEPPTQVFIAAGQAVVPSLVATAQTVVAVTIKPAMPDTNYTPCGMLSGSVSLLAALSITAIAVVDASTVNVTVKNTGLLTLVGGLALVVAVKN